MERTVTVQILDRYLAFQSASSLNAGVKYTGRSKTYINFVCFCVFGRKYNLPFSVHIICNIVFHATSEQPVWKFH